MNIWCSASNKHKICTAIHITQVALHFISFWCENSGFSSLLTGDEFVFRDPWGGISLMFAANQTTKTLMSNTTFVSILALSYLSNNANLMTT